MRSAGARPDLGRRRTPAVATSRRIAGRRLDPLRYQPIKLGNGSAKVELPVELRRGARTGSTIRSRSPEPTRTQDIPGRHRRRRSHRRLRRASAQHAGGVPRVPRSTRPPARRHDRAVTVNHSPKGHATPWASPPPDQKPRSPAP